MMRFSQIRSAFTMSTHYRTPSYGAACFPGTFPQLPPELRESIHELDRNMKRLQKPKYVALLQQQLPPLPFPAKRARLCAAHAGDSKIRSAYVEICSSTRIAVEQRVTRYILPRDDGFRTSGIPSMIIAISKNKRPNGGLSEGVRGWS